MSIDPFSQTDTALRSDGDRPPRGDGDAEPAFAARFEVGQNGPETGAPAEKIPERGYYTEGARLTRLGWIREKTGAPLDSYSDVPFQSERLTGNIENLVGSVAVPVGLAGPLLIQGAHVDEVIYAPFATTEGCLVASASRGALAITNSGGVRTQVVRQVMTRAPAYRFANIHQAAAFIRWVEAHEQQIREQAEAASGHARLIALEPHQVGARVHLRFVFQTGDAAGQNMTTACAWRGARWILNELRRDDSFDVTHFLIDGNLSGDKKVNWMSVIGGRGTRVTAEAVLKADVIRDVLKTSTAELIDAHRAILSGTFLAGGMGYHINIANTLAAMFTATGQDIACVHESAIGVLGLEVQGEDLYASLLLPGLIVGTVGGGTHLPNQRDALEMMGCVGPNSLRRLAEIIAGFCLALDLSTLSAVASGQFVAAHERLGRNRPQTGFGIADVTPALLNQLTRTGGSDGELIPTGGSDMEIVRVESLSDAVGSSILSEMTARRGNSHIGLFPARLHAVDGSTTDVVAKIKPVGDEIALMVRASMMANGDLLASVYEQYEDQFPWADSHTRELAIYRDPHPAIARHRPAVYGTFEDASRDAYLIVMERLGADIEALNSADDPVAWQGAGMVAVCEALGEIHSRWYGHGAELLVPGSPFFKRTLEDMIELMPLWDLLSDNAFQEFPDVWTAHDVDWLADDIATLDTWWGEFDAMAQTLIHNDLNPRNAALRRLPDSTLTLVAYDWELATWQVPQRDLAEMAAFVLTPDLEDTVVEDWVRLHRESFERFTGQSVDGDLWRRGFALSVRDFAIDRLMMYLLGHTQREYRFLPRVVAATRRLREMTSTW
jgi:NADP-dependent 3-hydroxy-3-methylglutaryl-CoA reductase